MKFKLIAISVFVTLLMWVMATAVMAQEETPPPYDELENPFPWSDASAQEAGNELYQSSCMGCHGIDGNNIAGADFSAISFSQSLEERSDFYFWLLSEGRLDKGMPPFKSSLSEEQRWQVLTYIWSLSAAAVPAEAASPTQPPAEGEGIVFLMTTPEQARSGQPLILTAILHDKQGNPIKNDTVKFFIKVDFFTSGLMEIGEAVTNSQGIALLEYTPRLTGDIEMVAHHGILYTPHGESHEATATITIAEAGEPFYHPEVGIQLPAPGQEVFLGPASAFELEMGTAPMTALRLPGGILSWLLLVVVTVMVIWFTYFRVIYQVFRIPIRSEIRDTDTRRVPLIGFALVVAMGIFLVLMLITGPYSHLHLSP